MVKVTRVSTGGTLDIVFNVGGHPAILADQGWSGVLPDEAAAVLQGDPGLAAHFTFEPMEPAKVASASKGKAGAKASAVDEPAAPAGE